MPSKNIVICSDGTGNTANKGRGTNVFKLFEAIDLHGHEHGLGPRQIAIYDDGVGTEKMRLVRVFGGAFGMGLSRNVKQLYTELVRIYNPRDKIYLFGFSRGAFTVRTLAGLIVGCGILDRKNKAIDSEKKLGAAVKATYKAYRYRYASFLQRLLRFKPWDKEKLSLRAKERRSQFRQKYKVHQIPDPTKDKLIEFIGVWDTVDAVGLPIDELALFINIFIFRFKFPSRYLSPAVRKACQALAIDDERRTFHPRLWKLEPGDSERIEQVWFPGVHSNVGGGYPKQGMSLVTLDWMMQKAEDADLRFLPGVRQNIHNHQNINDKLYDSRSGIWFFYRYLPRNIFELCAKSNVDPPMIHDTICDRAICGSGGYVPGNLPFNARLASTIPTSEDDSERQKHFLETLDAAIPGGASIPDRTSILDSIRITKWTRYCLHIATMICALGFIISFAITAWELDVSKWRAIVDPVVWLWLAAGVVFLVLTLRFRTRMVNMFAQKWFLIRQALEEESVAH